MLPRLSALAALLFCALPALAAEAPEGYKLAFEDSFGEGSLEKFIFTDASAWQLVEEDGNTVLGLTGESKYMPLVRSPRNIAWVKGFEAQDFILEVKAKQTGREYGHRDLCFFFGRQDVTHFYYVHLASVADDHANSIFLVDGKPRVSIAEKRTDGTKWTDGYHQIRIKRSYDSGLIEVFFDDMESPVMTAVDRHFGMGMIGLGSFDDVGNFDDLKIYVKE
jgi:hypothetical protein